MKTLLTLLAMILATLSPAQAMEISFREKASVTGEVVRLGDIAELGESTALAASLAQQIVAQAPEAGASLLLHGQGIVSQLRARADAPGELSFAGATATAVSRRAQSIDNERVMAMISEFFASNRHRLPPAQISFTPAAPLLPFAIPEGQLEVEVIPSNPNILGSSSFSLILSVDGRVVKNMSVRGKLQAMAQVVVASQPLRRGLTLDSSHLGEAAVDIDSLPEAQFDPQSLIGRVLTRSLAAGSPILGSMAEEPPVIRRGQMVRMVISTGALQLSATGMAHSDGRLEQMIKVQNLSSNKTIHGRVSGPGVVEVLL